MQEEAVADIDSIAFDYQLFSAANTFLLPIVVITIIPMHLFSDIYTLDYNQEANFWGAQTANHPELILPFLDTITYHLRC